jgi:hypothetical protein
MELGEARNACVVSVFYEKRVILKLRIVYTNQGERLPGRERGRAPRKTEREGEVQGHIETCAEFEQENLQSKPKWCLALDTRL